MISMTFENKDDLERKLYDFKIMFAYHSNKIENKDIDFHNTRDIFEHGRVTGYTGELRTLYEIENQKQCYEYLKPLILQKKCIDLDLIKNVHYKLMKGTYDEHRYIVNKERPGEFKKHDYVTGVHEIVSYPHEVEAHMKDLINEINKSQSTDYVTIAVYFHAMLEHIHAFADGNGRLGRTLLNYYLMIHDIAPVVIYEEDRRNYYDALEQFDLHDTLDPLKAFIEESQSKTWSKKKGYLCRSLSNHTNQ